MTIMDLLPISKMESKKNARKKVAIAAAVGATAGVVAGILLAPKAGKETRDELMNNIQELPDKAKALSDKTQELIGEAKDKIAEETHKILCGAKEASSDMKKEQHEDSQFQKPTEITEEQIAVFKKKLT